MGLVDDLVTSIRSEPERWHWQTIWLKRDDGLEVAFQEPYTGKIGFAVWVSPERGRIKFGWWQRRRLLRAFRDWQMRPLSPPTGKE